MAVKQCQNCFGFVQFRFSVWNISLVNSNGVSSRSEKHWGGCLSFDLLSISVVLGALRAIFLWELGFILYFFVFLILEYVQFKSGLCRIASFNSDMIHPLIYSLRSVLLQIIPTKGKYYHH